MRSRYGADVYVDTIVPFVQAAGSETAVIPYAYKVSQRLPGRDFRVPGQ